MLQYCKAGDYDRLADYLMRGVRHLENSGADFIAMASNTPHVVFDRLQAQARVPMLSIVEPVCRAVLSQGFQKIAWLGTGFTMEQLCFRTLFTDNGIAAAVPAPEERKVIDTIIAAELEFGIVKAASKEIIDRIILRMTDEENVEAVILGCTELPLMYAGAQLPVPSFDTLQYHIEGIIQMMLED